MDLTTTSSRVTIVNLNTVTEEDELMMVNDARTNHIDHLMKYGTYRIGYYYSPTYNNYRYDRRNHNSYLEYIRDYVEQNHILPKAHVIKYRDRMTSGPALYMRSSDVPLYADRVVLIPMINDIELTMKYTSGEVIKQTLPRRSMCVIPNTHIHNMYINSGCIRDNVMWVEVDTFKYCEMCV
jgi:hypothetical protein